MRHCYYDSHSTRQIVTQRNRNQEKPALRTIVAMYPESGLICLKDNPTILPTGSCFHVTIRYIRSFYLPFIQPSPLALVLANQTLRVAPEKRAVAAAKRYDVEFIYCSGLFSPQFSTSALVVLVHAWKKVQDSGRDGLCEWGNAGGAGYGAEIGALSVYMQGYLISNHSFLRCREVNCRQERLCFG